MYYWLSKRLSCIDALVLLIYIISFIFMFDKPLKLVNPRGNTRFIGLRFVGTVLRGLVKNSPPYKSTVDSFPTHLINLGSLIPIFSCDKAINRWHIRFFQCFYIHLLRVPQILCLVHCGVHYIVCTMEWRSMVSHSNFKIVRWSSYRSMIDYPQVNINILIMGFATNYRFKST